jgi:hypothetical protein
MPPKTIAPSCNTYTGASQVNSGTLLVNGSIASSSGLAVNSGGTVGGTGILPTTQINAEGALSPGAGTSIGTITVQRWATIGYLTAMFEPTDPSSAALVKIHFDDGEVLFLTPIAVKGSSGEPLGTALFSVGPPDLPIPWPRHGPTLDWPSP